MKYFVTYGDAPFKETKGRLVKEVYQVHEFDKIYALTKSDISPDLVDFSLMKIKKGGGLWCWKPDIILKVMNYIEENDILVYCDSGCTVTSAKEWKKYWKLLDKYDIIAQKIYQPTYKWTRSEIINSFVDDNGMGWEYSFQFQATIIILKKTEFTKRLISQWREYILNNPNHIIDVNKDERIMQSNKFIENRHDQSVYSAFIYKYLNSTYTSKIATMWEHIENKDIIYKQAVRATRIRNCERLTWRKFFFEILKRLIKDYFYKPFIIIPENIYFNYRRKYENS